MTGVKLAFQDRDDANPVSLANANPPARPLHKKEVDFVMYLSNGNLVII